MSAETLIATEDGYIAISDIELGDEVLAYNEVTGEVDSYTVVGTIQHIDPEIIVLNTIQVDCFFYPMQLYGQRRRIGL